MDRAPWRDRAALPALLLIAMLSTAVTPAAMSAGLSPAGASVDCRTITPSDVAHGVLAAPNARAATVRVQAQLARRGELTGRVITSQSAAGVPISIVLPAESFVGPAVGDVVVYTGHSAAAGSQVRALNLASGCDVRLAAPAEIVRSALIDPSASAVYVHSVTRADRADAGVLRYDLVTGKAAMVLPPLSAPDGFGPIFGTDLRWDVYGQALAVQSCGFSLCLTRVVDISSGKITTFDRPGQGAFIGLTREHLLTFAGCPGLPCAVLSADVVTGSVSVIADEAFSAGVKATDPEGTVFVIETAAGQLEVVQ